jgi:hypothetical protein
MRFLVCLFMLLGVMFADVDPAQARRIRLPFVIPGMGASETIVKVQDLPRVPWFVSKDGEPIDLGYLWKLDGSGEWVGHIGSDQRYLAFKPEMLDAMMKLAGIDEMPPIPERPTSSAGTIWIALGVLFAGLAWFRRFKRRSGSAIGGDELARADIERAMERATKAPSAAPTSIIPTSPVRASTGSTFPDSTVIAVGHGERSAFERPTTASGSARPSRLRQSTWVAVDDSRPAFGRRGLSTA